MQKGSLEGLRGAQVLCITETLEFCKEYRRKRLKRKEGKRNWKKWSQMFAVKCDAKCKSVGCSVWNFLVRVSLHSSYSTSSDSLCVCVCVCVCVCLLTCLGVCIAIHPEVDCQRLLIHNSGEMTHNWNDNSTQGRIWKKGWLLRNKLLKYTEILGGALNFHRLWNGLFWGEGIHFSAFRSSV